MPIFASLLCGFVFGCGLTISGMIQPAKVLGFLDFFGGGCDDGDDGIDEGVGDAGFPRDHGLDRRHAEGGLQELGANFVETIPNVVVVVEVKATGECDFRSWRHHDLGLGAALGGDEIS